MNKSLKTNFKAKKSWCDQFMQCEILSLRYCAIFPLLESPKIKMHLTIKSVLDSMT